MSAEGSDSLKQDGSGGENVVQKAKEGKF